MRMVHIILLGLCGCVSAGTVDGAAAAAPPDREQRRLQTVSRMLTDPARSPQTKYDAATLLLGREDQAATGMLAAILADESRSSARIAVARAIADMSAGRRAFVDPLLTMLGHDDDEVRQAAAAALGIYTDEAVLARVAQRAADPDAPEPTRLTAIESLARRIEAQSVETLIDLLESPQPTIQTAAADALQQLTGMRQFGADPLRWRYWWQANQSKPRQQWLADQVEALTCQTETQQRHVTALAERL
ncbi:MAG: HEAT repeat domain-containing protein, partial [Planctomycetota bacterium]